MSNTNDTQLNINLTSAEVLLNTKETYVDKDIHLTVALEEKNVTPAMSAQEITPDTNIVGLSKVTVSAVETEVKSVIPSNSAQTVTPTANKFISKVTVAKTPLTTLPTLTPLPDVQRIYPINTGDIGAKANFESSSSDLGISVPPVYTYVATSAEMDALLVRENAGKFYVYTGETDGKYTKNDLYQVEAEFTVTVTANANLDQPVEIFGYNTNGETTILESVGQSKSLVCNTLIMKFHKAPTASNVLYITINSTSDGIEVLEETSITSFAYIFNDGTITVSCGEA